MPTRPLAAVAVSVALIACGGSSANAPAQPETERASERPAWVGELLGKAESRCADLVGRLLSLTEAEGTQISDGWKSALEEQLVLCAATDYSEVETRCMKSAQTVDVFAGCTADRRQAALDATWLDNIDEGLALGRTANKPVLIHFFAEWCVPCILIEKDVLADSTVKAALSSRFISVKYDVTRDDDEQERQKERFRIETLPALLVVDATGRELARLGDVPTVAKFLELLRSIE